jgi:hypothetical protein
VLVMEMEAVMIRIMRQMEMEEVTISMQHVCSVYWSACKLYVHMQSQQCSHGN